MKPHKIQRGYTVYKVLISFIFGLAGFIAVFALDRLLINWILGHFTSLSHDVILIIKIGFWILSFSWTVAIAIFVGFIIGRLVGFLLGLD